MEKSFADDPFREDKHRFRRLIDHLTDYIYTVTLENGVVISTYHGPGCLAVTGYSSADYENDPELWFQMVYKADRYKVTEHSLQALGGKQVPPLEHRIWHKDGSIRWIRNTIVLNKNDCKELVSYDGLINDITELKKAADDANEREKQLIHADKLASLGVLSAGVAHEINNPNNLILLNAQLIADVFRDAQPVLNEYFDDNGEFYLAGMAYSQARDDLRRLVFDLIGASKRIKKIIENLKSFVRQDSGELNSAVSVNMIIESARRIIASMIAETTNHFSFEAGKDLPLITGNYQQLEQVLVNLMINGCQALRHRSDALSVKSFLVSNGQEIAIEVHDEGRGIDAETLDRIFDPFFTTKRDTGGTGLGLFISYQIIKQHGGELHCNSDHLDGTTFKITLPVTSKIKLIEDQ